MAYNKFKPQTEDPALSKFNPAAFQMQRIHELQKSINERWDNPMAYDYEKHKYNYEIIFSCLNSLLSGESFDKLTEEEKIDLSKLRTEIREALEKYPIYEEKVSGSYPHKKYIKFNKHYWKVHEKMLEEYREKIIEALGNHELTSPKKDVYDIEAQYQ